MSEGYISDADNDETVMETPEATVSIDLTQLQPEQALGLIQQSDTNQQEPWVLGALMQGDDVTDSCNDAEFHLSFGAALNALASVGAVEQPEQPTIETEDDNE